MEEIKAKFNQRYANLPEGARGEIIAVVKNEPYTWRSARVEIENNTVIGNEILEFLAKSKIIQ
jgi:hypothetical protein